MALTNLSSRNLNKISRKDGLLGPGFYFDQELPDTKRMFAKIQKPKDKKKHIERQSNPGPGYYDIID